ncbi:hypothetical protein TNCV_2447541 [Trichonephila clavipes]|uniref:Uncharacterized protein n=1 Tax=Trichonephila clavipes TaxID=2585209 RepID=A0A8X6VLP3_TRICX|nr:hypothetical protein TNCV_2447541 [Trichonephila clavipes]
MNVCWASLLKLKLDSSLRANWFRSVAVQFRQARSYSKWRRWKDTRACHEGSVCVLTGANEAVVSTRACRMMCRFSRRLVCRLPPEPRKILQGKPSSMPSSGIRQRTITLNF